MSTRLDTSATSGADAPPPQTAAIAQAIQEVSEKAQLLVREEIELAKLEVQTKVKNLVRGAAIGIAAGIFAIIGLLFLLHGLAWLAFYALPVNSSAVFWGYLLVAGVLFLLGGLAGFIASKAIKKGSPPTPQMAIDEAQLIKQTVQSSHPEQTV